MNINIEFLTNTHPEHKPTHILSNTKPTTVQICIHTHCLVAGTNADFDLQSGLCLQFCFAVSFSGHPTFKRRTAELPNRNHSASRPRSLLFRGATRLPSHRHHLQFVANCVRWTTPRCRSIRVVVVVVVVASRKPSLLQINQLFNRSRVKANYLEATSFLKKYFDNTINWQIIVHIVLLRDHLLPKVSQQQSILYRLRSRIAEFSLCIRSARVKRKQTHTACFCS